MPIIVKDRVQESTTTTGTGALTLSGAITGYQTFSSAIGNGNLTYYAIFSAGSTEWEVGIGTVGAGTLARTTILASSNAGSVVTLSAGIKNVICTYPASKAGFAVSVSATSPSNPTSGDLWYDSTNGVMLIYYNDGTTSQWVEDYESQLASSISLPDMNGGTASTTSWAYEINCGGAS